MIRIRFLPEDRTWTGAAGTPLSVAAAAADIFLEQSCGRGTCGRCRVHVTPPPAASPADIAALGRPVAQQGWRLGCRLFATHDMDLHVPVTARVVAHKSFGDDRLVPAGFERVRSEGAGVALDIGSTTLAAAIIDLATGAVLGSASALNPQVRFGADVMSRIAFAASRPDGAALLHDVLIDALEQLIASAAAQACVDVTELREATAVGNPTMLHTLLSLPVHGLGEAPYQGVQYGAWIGEAADVGLALPAATLLVLPGIRAHVGADAVAAALATDLDRADAPVILLDLGTNTELLLRAGDRLLCASASAGPAFEGAAIRCGMRAIPGAIDQVRITGDGMVHVHTVAAVPALGICGSGLVDLAAELLRVNVIDPSGRLRATGELPASQLRERLRDTADGGEFQLTADAAPVVLTARDIRELQVIKASIGAAIRLLLRAAHLEPDQVSKVLLAGAFGTYISGRSADLLGLLGGIPAERVRFVGNAAGAGARLALVDAVARARAERIAAAAEFVELAGRPDYQEEFVAMIAFPRPDSPG